VNEKAHRKIKEKNSRWAVSGFHAKYVDGKLHGSLPPLPGCPGGIL
jgi:hypothetical protein